MRIAVFYATREGQTQRIAEHIASLLRERGIGVDVFEVKSLHTPLDWETYDTACVAASVHVGHHEREMVAFVRRHRQALERVSAAFLSVTLSEAGAEDVNATNEKRQQFAADARRMIDVFVKETGWRPARVLPVAGALAYSRYNPLIKFVMKRIARRAGASTDTTRDREYTDWPALDRFVVDLVNVPGRNTTGHGPEPNC